MKPDFDELDTKVAQARVILSLIALLSLYVDPSLGGLFHLETWLLAILLCHLLYSALTYLALTHQFGPGPDRKISAGFDLLFATIIAFLTEGRTSPSFIFFVFAIVAEGFRTGFRDTLLITMCCVTLYALAVEVSDRLLNTYLMRPVYLAIAGYLIGSIGQQRTHFERRLHQLETQAEREAIARSLHDGYLQALAGISLRLESCRDMLNSEELEAALAEITETQLSVCREYDEVRGYVHSLAWANESATDLESKRSGRTYHADCS
jgi:signal transduction histidine kinase